MHKMLAIACLVALSGVAPSGAAWAADTADRSALSYDENAVINIACAKSSVEGTGAFNSCVAQQLVALHDHPTPDSSALTPAHKRAINDVCGYLKRQGIGPYNDCLAKALVHSAKDEHRQSKVLAAGRSSP